MFLDESNYFKEFGRRFVKLLVAMATRVLHLKDLIDNYARML
jgi:hypothetical protein